MKPIKRFTPLVILLLVASVFGFSGTDVKAATTHTVSSGDTMWKMAIRYQIGVREIIQANPELSNPDLIYPGQRLTIPSESSFVSVEEEVIRLVNEERAKSGLQPLENDWELSRIARFKSEDMRDKNYFSHTSPTYGSPHQMIQDFGVTYRASGENIAAGQTSGQAVFNAWMDSPGHRENILSSNYTHIGVGYGKGGSYGHYWTQMFIGR